jgi:hypothetical protein
MLREPAEHLRTLEDSGLIDRGKLVLTQTHRNCPQNDRCPIYSHLTGICQNKHELATSSMRPYYGIAHLSDGRLRPEALDFRKPVPSDIRYFSAGTVVLWEDKVCDDRMIVTETADPSHMWDLQADAANGSPGKDVHEADRLSALFRKFRHASADEAATALLSAATGHGRQTCYLHNALAVGGDCVIIVVAHGSLEAIGSLCKQAGASHAVIMDNGGSVNIGLRRVGMPLRSIVESHYHRPLTITLCAFELDFDEAGRSPFVGWPTVGPVEID